jgi:hypothetical protein
MTPTTNETTKKPQGFATLLPERRREIASLGGRTAHAQGKAHKFTSEEAKLAGQRGGQISRRRSKVS